MTNRYISTELNTPQSDDRNEHVYYELHLPDEQRGSSQQQAPSSVDKPVIKRVVFLSVVLLMILLLLVITVLLTAVILVTMTNTTVLDPESVQHLLNQQVSHLQNNSNTVNLIKQSSENTTQKLINQHC